MTENIEANLDEIVYPYTLERDGFTIRRIESGGNLQTPEGLNRIHVRQITKDLPDGTRKKWHEYLDWDPEIAEATSPTLRDPSQQATQRGWLKELGCVEFPTGDASYIVGARKLPQSTSSEPKP